MRRILLVAALFLFVAANTGCQYAKDRLKDTIDIIGFKVVGGQGFKLGVGFGAAHTGLNFGYYRIEKFGFQGRAMGVWEESGIELLAPADHHLAAVWGNKELFDMCAEFQKVDGYASRAALFDDELTYPRRRYLTPDGFHISDMTPFAFPNPFLEFGDLQVSGLFPIFGVFGCGLEVNVSWYQLADWFLSWFYLDIAKDDSRNYTPIGPSTEEAE